MDIHEWRRELDKLAEVKGILVSLNPALDEQTSRQMRHLFDTFATITKLENDLASSGFMKKRKVQTQLEKNVSEFEDDFMRLTRDFADILRKEHKDVLSVVPKLEAMKPQEAKALSSLAFPSVSSGDVKDLSALHSFGKNFSGQYNSLHQEFSMEVKTTLDENKRTVETYERHVTIDRGEVTTTVSNEEVSHLPIAELIRMMEKLKTEKTYLDGRKDEVSRMLGTSLMSDVEGLQAYVETGARLGLDLPIDFSQKLRILARDASKANNLTTLVTLESQFEAARQQMANMLRDKIINMKHDVTTKIVNGGIPTTSDVIPEAPTVGVEGDDIASLLSAYQVIVEWTGQVRIALKGDIEEALEEVEKAADKPEDSGIKDVLKVREYIVEAKKELKKADIDGMVKIHLKVKQMSEEYKKYITDTIREYLARFNELATSADRVLDYAQLSKKAPKVEELEGGIVYLLQSLETLKQSVESGVATFRDACEQEIEAIIADLQTIKPVYAEIFMPIIVELDEGGARIKVMEEFAEIRSEMRTIKETILVKARDSLENLRYRLGVKIRLAAAKLMGAGVEIPKEVQEAISELNSVGVASDNVFGLPAIARKMVEIYERKISAKVLESLIANVTTLKESFDRAKSIGVDVDKELKILTGLEDKPPEELEDAAEAFDRLQGLTTSESVHKKVKERAYEAYNQLNEAVSLFEEQGMSDFVIRLKTLLDQVPAQLEAGEKHVNQALEVCLTLANIQEEMLGVIKDIAGKNKEEHDVEIKEKSKYYSTIERVFENHPKDFDKLIFPLLKLQTLETSLSEAKMLDEAIKQFNEIIQMRSDWVVSAEKMDDWHKSLRMFMTGFSAAASTDERGKFIDEAVKKIKETYSREDISTYLTWALKEITDTMVEKRG
ncbi:MAG: hypothetical protein RTU30_11200 [Candidatus Thorarchaeota archaeon]